MDNFSRGAGLDDLSKRFGGSLQARSSVVVVGATLVEVVPFDIERISLTLVNDSATELFVDTTPLVSSNRGIRIGPNGGLLNLGLTDDGILPLMGWFAVGGAAGLNLYVLQVRREAAYP